jgi:phage terminase Nu1 subunit (DNA packaging protein)
MVKHTTSRKPLARTATAATVCDELDISKSTLQNYLARGCPYTKGGPRRQSRYDVAEVAAWMRANNLTGNPGRPPEASSPALDAARLRKENAMATNWELRNAEAQGLLVDANQVRERWVRRGTMLRNTLESAGGQLAPRLAGRDVAECRRVLNEFVQHALANLENDDG